VVHEIKNLTDQNLNDNQLKEIISIPQKRIECPISPHHCTEPHLDQCESSSVALTQPVSRNCPTSESHLKAFQRSSSLTWVSQKDACREQALIQIKCEIKELLLNSLVTRLGV
jgi:hypothetical protein